MKSFLKKHGYLCFVLLIIGLLVGGYAYQHHSLNLPAIQVSSQQHKYVRHEKNENQLTDFESYVEVKLGAHFTRAQMQQAAIYLVGTCLLVLVIEPIVVYFVYANRPVKQVPRQKSKVFDAVRIDHDIDTHFQL